MPRTLTESQFELLAELLAPSGAECAGPDAAVVRELEELGYLNEAEYAGRIVRHYAAKGFGERKLRDELYRRGVPRELWEEALTQVEDNSETIDAFLEKKLKGGRDPKDIKKVSDALARRGFAWPEISDALRRYGMEVWD